jgi:hypothetical protein
VKTPSDLTRWLRGVEVRAARRGQLEDQVRALAHRELARRLDAWATSPAAAALDPADRLEAERRLRIGVALAFEDLVQRVVDAVEVEVGRATRR